ncbi:uncharacterized protein LY89DRAFT_777056 [Mollisia scopiformis]|uniref:Uncharacterized protein n=1 Tax=Mollisia scopiformis TaxID=149040 RepID=A0A194XSV0_MOLSC|nr:uncharacterized protein LY89DRAFT_777056 [Mollisia scopiformis]KUJ23273.1 hypothetical protein LY89DRAFT_777056 [Mollisia scopiformis]
MPALDPRIVQGLSEVGASILVARDSVPKHEIIEAFLVIFVSVFGVGGAIIWAARQ